MSTFGTLFRVTTFGESHCAGLSHLTMSLVDSLRDPGPAMANGDWPTEEQ
jgi:hypothetical protein